MFSHLPSAIEAPTYNFASRLIKKQNGFIFPTIFDIPAMTSDGTKFAMLLRQENSVLLYDQQPATPDLVTPSRILGQTTFTATLADAGMGSTNGV